MAEQKHNLVLPDDIYAAIKTIADERGLTVLDVVRAFLKLGLIADRIDKSPDDALIYRTGDRERELVLFS